MKQLNSPIQVTKSYLPPIEEYIEEIRSIWNTNWITNNGEIHNRLQEELKKYLNVKNTVLFSNGHAALDIAIKSLKLSGEVITTPFTFASTTHAIVMNNLTPVFCDIKLDDFTIDENKIEDLITEKTTAIIPVHVFGYPCNVEKIKEIANKHNLNVIYDSAHVFGVEINGEGVGNYGDISMFSLHATKVYNTIEGGLLTTRNRDLVESFKKLKNFGITGPESVEEIGLNAKMNEFQAAMGIVNLKHIDEEISKRKIITEIYIKELESINGIYYLKEKNNIKLNYSYFPIVINEKITGISRDDLYERLKQYNIFTRKYFYPLVTNFQCYKGMYDDSKLNNAKYISERILTLPIYGELAEEDVYLIVDAIKRIIKGIK
jgi:dTDP-4-amino-4,6-dideoxygalactose transaminase